MRRMTLLVGPPGTGKTTYSQKYLEDNAIRISQDDQGKDGHWQAFLDALNEGRDIVIDRTNFLREQRKKYLEEASKRGYETHIIIMNKPLGVCMDNISKRPDHPTLAAGSPKIKEALIMYFNKYEYVLDGEADVIENLSPDGFDPYLMDLTHRYEAGRRFIVVGDIHGCYDELMELLEKVQWSPMNDILVFTGDLIDRGPKVKEVLEFKLGAMNSYSIMSNHENKLFRYMLGNKVQSRSLATTLAQCDENLLKRYFVEMQSMPLILRFGEYNVLHAGINPRYDLERQTREFLMYARKFNPANGSFSDEGMPYWYTYPMKQQGVKVLFGHEVHPNTSAVAEHAYALDAGCVFGDKLRAFVVTKGEAPMIVEVKSKQPPRTHKDIVAGFPEGPLSPYDERVKKGLLSKAVKGDLVLYKYTDKCAYEKAWDKYTLEARGLMFDSLTGEVIARPFSKFFNLGEMEATLLQNLPQEAYEVFDKLDGSMGVMYPYEGRLNIATLGSFESPQSQVATQILQERYEANIVKHVHPYLTLLFEIVYPENRMSMGARLVVDYGHTRDIFLLAAIDRTTGMEISRAKLEELAGKIGCPIAKKYYYTIQQMIELQKTLPATQEGFVVRFESGFRVKIKGEEYLKMSRILNSITPLNIWDLMGADEQMQVPGSYLATIPEEYRDEALDMVIQLKKNANKVMTEIRLDIETMWADGVDMSHFKTVGLWLQKNSGQLKHSTVIFTYIKGQKSALYKYVKRAIRPTNNIL